MSITRLETSGKNPRNFCRYANSRRKDSQDIPPLKRRDDSGLAESESDLAEEFNRKFTDVFTQSRVNEAPVLDRSAPRMNDIAVSAEVVIKLLKGLNPSKAMGLDELNPRIVKELAAELGQVFAHLFQQSFDTGEIPGSLANICPLFHKGDRALTSNYRPVSLTCILCKLLEHIVYSSIMDHLEKHSLSSTCIQEKTEL